MGAIGMVADPIERRYRIGCGKCGKTIGARGSRELRRIMIGMVRDWYGVHGGGAAAERLEIAACILVLKQPEDDVKRPACLDMATKEIRNGPARGRIVAAVDP